MSHLHRHYQLGPFEKSLCVIFRYLKPNEMTVHFVFTEDVTTAVISSEENSIFKIPAGHTATVEISEVAVGPGADNEGRFLFSARLDPSTAVTAMGHGTGGGAAAAKLAGPGGGVPLGECSGSGECATSGTIVCQRGYIPFCDNGVLTCKKDEAGADQD